ncbi:MAG TPA: hypothetical protein DCG12_01625, partial [Planctomycetaceae bacterium]|nr:hypothetical protein [Planctomycetaceae bacterium]
ADGKTVVEKLSSGRVIKMLNAGMLTAKARAKTSSSGSYMPLSQFPEFTEAVERSLTRHTTQVRKEDMKSLYQQVEKDEKKRLQWRWVRNKFRSMVGAAGLVVWIAAILGVLGLGYLLFKESFVGLGEKVKEMMN